MFKEDDLVWIKAERQGTYGKELIEKEAKWKRISTKFANDVSEIEFTDTILGAKLGYVGRYPVYTRDLELAILKPIEGDDDDDCI